MDREKQTSSFVEIFAHIKEHHGKRRKGKVPPELKVGSSEPMKPTAVEGKNEGGLQSPALKAASDQNLTTVVSNVDDQIISQAKSPKVATGKLKGKLAKNDDQAKKPNASIAATSLDDEMQVYRQLTAKRGISSRSRKSLRLTEININPDKIMPLAQPKREFSIRATRKGSAKVKPGKTPESPEWASDPKEFTSSGTPIPFWEFEMRKGPEYLMKLHKKYGSRKKHELVPAYKPDMEVISVDTNVSLEDIDTSQILYDRGLRSLIPVDRLFLLHHQAITSAILGCANKVTNQYLILNYHGHLLYTMSEGKESCLKTFIMSTRGGHETMVIKQVPVVVEARRKYVIYCPSEQKIGSITQWWSYPSKKPGFSIYDTGDIEIIQFEKAKPKLKSGKNPDLLFEYKSPRGQGPLGTITIKLADLKMANFTESDYYGIRIIKELPANIKVKILAAWFIIYRIYYVGRTFIDVNYTLSDKAKQLYSVRKPSTEEIPNEYEDELAFIEDFDD